MDTLVCGVCLSSFTCLTSLIEHKVTHLQAGQAIKCPLCCKYSSESSGLIDHLRRFHLVEDELAGAQTTQYLQASQRYQQHGLKETCKDVNIAVSETVKETSKNVDIAVSETVKETSKDVNIAVSETVKETSKNVDIAVSETVKETSKNMVTAVSETLQQHLQTDSGAQAFVLNKEARINTSQSKADDPLPSNQFSTSKKCKVSSLGAEIHSTTTRATPYGSASLEDLISSSQTVPQSNNNTAFESEAENISPPQPNSFNSAPVSCSMDTAECGGGDLCHFDNRIKNCKGKHPLDQTSRLSTGTLVGESVLLNSCLPSSQATPQTDTITTIEYSISLPPPGTDQNACSENDEKITGPNVIIDFYFLLGSVRVKGKSGVASEFTRFRCLHCKFSTSWRPSLTKHMKEAHKETLDIHNIVEMRTRNLSYRSCANFNANAISTWNNCKVIKMSDFLLSQRKTRTRGRRKRNLEVQDVPGQYPCPVCHKTFTRLRYMRRHYAIHSDKPSYLCDKCGKCFKARAVLLSHHCSHPTSTQEAPYHCPECDFTSGCRAAIREHRQVHPCGALLCHVCGAAYPDRSTLRRHVKVHDPSRPFPCCHPGCTWRFMTEVMCRAHERSHTLSLANKFQCPDCGYNFRHKHHLQRHVAKFHHGCQDDVTDTDLPCVSDSHTLSSSFLSDSSTVVARHPDPNPSLSVSQAALSSLVAVTPNNAPAAVGSNQLQGDQTRSPHFQQITGFHQVDKSALSVEHCYIDNISISTTNVEENYLLSQTTEEEMDVRVKVDSNMTTMIETRLDVGQLLKPGQTLVGRDHDGNLVHYEVAEIADLMQDQESAQSCHPYSSEHNIYFIEVDS